jgi:hypothetical protein
VKEGTDDVLEIFNKFAPGSKESRQLQRFMKAWNEEIANAGGVMTKRSALSAADQALSDAWKKLTRLKYPGRFKGKVVGHTPDAIMGGGIAGPRAMALLPSVNSYLGGVAGGVASGTSYNSVRLFR